MWYMNTFVGTVYQALFVEDKPEDKLKFEEVHRTSNSKVGGVITYYIKKQPEKEAGVRNKTLMLIPGATGDSDGGHIMVMAAEAYRNGFNIIVCNTLAPRESDNRKDLEAINYIDIEPIS